MLVSIPPQRSMSSTRITINDLSGKLLYTKETTAEKLISISTNGLTAGIYLIYIESLEAKKVFKFIVR
jgi:S-ribosylhomocysteine lyase LuxS involved in autoinducer biosynthesis